MKVFFKILILILCFTFGHKANANNISIERVETLVSDSAETDSLDTLINNRNPKKHLTFMGIPITGTIDQFSAKLRAKGIRYDYKVSARLDKGTRGFYGTFMGETNRFITVQFNPYTKVVYEVTVFLNHCDYDQAWNKYIRIYPQLVNKYQNQLLCGKEYDGDDKEKYAYFFLENGNISLSIYYDEEEYDYYNVISYTDLINYRKDVAKNKQVEYNDL